MGIGSDAFRLLIGNERQFVIPAQAGIQADDRTGHRPAPV
jgi:hypothetical protein